MRGIRARANAAADPGIPRADDRAAAHAFQRVRRASYSRGNIEIIDVDDTAENLIRVRPEFRTRRGRALNATNSRRPRVAAPWSVHLEGLDAAPNACVDLPFLLADEMCKDATCISDRTH